MKNDSSRPAPPRHEERIHCTIVAGDELEHLYTFRDFPVFMGVSDQPQENDLHHDMDWWIGKTSGLIQLKKLLPLEVIYAESHGSGEVGAVWDRHHTEFAQFIARFEPKAVFEIGGAHGILEKRYQQHKTIPWTILEPNPIPVEGCKAKFIQGFFDEKFKFDGLFDTVVHSHVLEHIYRPDDFMRQLSQFMSVGKRMIFTLPNFLPMLQRRQNCIHFEHTTFLTGPYIEHLLAKHGFKVLDKAYYKEDHSVFYATERAEGVQPLPIPGGSYATYKAMYQEYIRFHEEIIEDLNGRIASSTRPVYLFGAHVFAQYLIAFGLNIDRIVCLLDNDPKKQGKRLTGTHLRVESPRILHDLKDPVVILKAGVYNAEIRKDILDNINAKTEFWE